MIQDAGRQTLAADEKRRLLGQLLRERSRAWTGEHRPSVGQEALWALQELSPESAAYNFAYAFRMGGEVDLDALQGAFLQIQKRHAVLRTTYPSRQGGATALVPGDCPLDYATVDARSWPMDQLTQVLAGEAARPFDLERQLAMRIRVYRRGAAHDVLLLAFHHIAVDFWSGLLVLDELGAFYQAERTRQAPQLPELTLEYRDFAARQREMVEGEEGRRLLKYWTDRLSGEAPVLDLPLDFPRPARAAHRGAAHDFVLDAGLSQRIKRLARDVQTTPFAVLTSGFQALLARYSGQDRIWIGSPTVGRVRSDLAPVVGYFANPVVLRADLSGAPTFRELLAQQQEEVRGALEHQTLPFASIVEARGGVRQPSRSPLFDVMITVQSVHRLTRGGSGVSKRAQWDEGPPISAAPVGYGDARIELGGLVLETIPLPPCGAPFDLDVEMLELHDAFSGRLTYDADLFEPGSIARMARRYERLLAAATQQPDRPLAEIELIDDDERRGTLSGGSFDHAAARDTACMHHLFESSAQARPGAPAVSCGDRRLSYGEFDQMAERIAGALRCEGIGAGDCAAIWCGRPLNGLLSILAALKAGAAYVPLAPRDPAERRVQMVQDTQARVVLADHADEAWLSDTGARVMRVDELLRDCGAPTASNPAAGVGPDDLAYVMYTSGSTGRPKGVMVEHGSVVNHNRAVARLFDLRPDDRVLLLGPFSSDITVEQIFPTWLAGGCVVVPDDYSAPGWDELRRQVDRLGITVLNLPTAYWQAWVRDLAANGGTVPESLRLVVIGGEAAARQRCDEWLQIVNDRVRLINTYGPTEATVIATAFEIKREWTKAHPRRRIPIGRPIDGAYVYVLDRRGRPAPPGIAGELYIGGSGVARGYVKAPGLTGERFVENPFPERHGRRLYRTGDRARWLLDGTLEFLGREDEQLKVGGYRIEPGEIEVALAGHAAVKETAVVAYQEDGATAKLAAYVVAVNAEAPPDETELREHLRRALPDYMIPSIFVFLPALPRLPLGKIDRKSLPAPAVKQGHKKGEGGEPQTPAERTLVEIWQSVLNVARVGVEDNFFALGGDSIQCIQVAARAARAGVQVSPRQVFEHPTITELARVAASGAVVHAEQGDVTGAAPLTPIQAWFFANIREDVHHFNQALLIAPQKAIDADHLKRAVDKLLSHHDALRLRFERTESGWRQEFAPYHPAEVDEVVWRVDLRETPAGRLDEAIQQHATRAHAAIDLSYGPLLRVVWFDTGGRCDRLLITIHHLAVDGVSWRILLEDLELAYRQAARGEVAQLAPKTSSYRAWAERLPAYAASDKLADEAGFWRRIAEQASSPLPRDLARGDNDVASVDTLRIALDPEEATSLLRAAPLALGAPVQDVLLTALARAMLRWTGFPSLTLHVEGHGREDLSGDIDVSRTVGWFTSIYPVRIELNGDEDPVGAVASVRRQLRELPGHGVGYGVLRFLRPQTAVPAAPCEACFNYLGRLDVPSQDAMLFVPLDEPLGAPISPRVRRPHLLDVTAAVRAGRLEAAFTYSRNVHLRATIERISEAFVEELRGVIRHVAERRVGPRPPADFPLTRLDQAQLDRITGSAQDVEDIYPLTPLQAGLLMHSRYEPDPEVYFAQMSCGLRGRLDEARLHQAWQEVVNRHPALRTGFAWEGLEEPVQVVHARRELPWLYEDLRGQTPEEQARRVSEFCAGQRAQGFDLSRPPLLRIGLFRLDDDSWRFVASNHHLLFDGWSLAVLLSEVVQVYAALSLGRCAPDAPPPARFRDYIAWLQTRDEQAAAQFWGKTLAGCDGVNLSSIQRRQTPAACGPRRGEARRLLSAELTRRLEAFARREQVTLNTLVQAAWALVLSRYSQSRDVIFGATVSGRSAPLPGIETMIGLFINTIPVRIDVDDRRPVGPWLREIQARNAAGQPFEHSSLADVRRWSGLSGGEALFDTLVVFENYPHAASRAAPGFDGLQITEIQRSLVHTNYGLMAVVIPGDRLNLQLGFDRRRFEPDTVERLLEHFENALEGIQTDGGRSVAEVSLLGEHERHTVVTRFNETRRDYGPHRCVHDLIADQAARTPSATAVMFGDETLSYRELDQRANQLAHRLAELGAGPDAPVALYMERSIDLVVAILAILKAGAAFVPLETDYPPRRLAGMLAEVSAPVLVTHARLKDRLPAHDAHVLALDDPDELAAYPNTPPQVAVGPEDLAYIMYTSGSTGRPNAVANTHRGLRNRLLWMQEQFRLTDADRVLHKTPYGFDVSVWEFLWPLMTGAGLVVAAPGGHRDSRYLAETVDRYGVTTLHFVPSMLRSFLEEAPAERCGSLRRVICSGEALTLELQSRFFARYGAELHNLYGPTEASIDVAHWQCERSDVRGYVPIGRPIANIRLYVLDHEARPIPIGVPGELHIGGVGLARGYVNRPELNAARFIADPFDSNPGGRLYKTGDLCRWWPDGVIEFLGRIDEQVKVRGQRVEPGEIEAALLQRDDVAEAAVLAGDDQAGGTRLTAYVVARNGAQPSVGDLRAHLAERLPDAMVPEAFVLLDRLPRSASGKLDRRALPAAGTQRPELSSSYAPPRNELETCLAQLWQTVLKVDRVGIHDIFFDLGGNSIQAAQVIYQLERELGSYVYVVALFDAPTVAGLAGYLARNHAEAVAKRFGAEVAEAYGGSAPRSATVDIALVERFRRAIRPTIAHTQGSPIDGKARPCGKAVLVLSPPRSGSTLLRVMLAGHPSLFAPPELMLLNFDTLADRAAAFAGRDAFWLEGVVRALMELESCGVEDARAFMDRCTALGWTPADLFRHVQDRLGGRLLVDKTPPYALQPAVLERAEAVFDSPLYIHLVRHPLATINSFDQARLHVLFSPLFDSGLEGGFEGGPRDWGELFWLVSHDNIVKFLAGVPAARQLRIRFEDLVASPAAIMESTCAFLGLEMHPAVLTPYADRKTRMTDPVSPQSRMLGDVKFHERRGIDAEAADRWRTRADVPPIGALTRELASRLGYEVESRETGNAVARTGAAIGPFTGLDTTALAARAVLDESIRPAERGSPRSTRPSQLLLTGANGFLGTFLLHELLTQTDAHVFCLVRADSPDSGRRRLASSLQHYGLADQTDLSRVTPVPGDLSKPQLGLGNAAFDDLSERIDAVYHNGAWVNFIQGFDRLKPANVDGTAEVLRLAARRRAKPVHYVSSLAVFPSLAAGARPVYDESDTLDHGGLIFGGYPQTKWVGEKLVREAARRGLEVSIYRPGRITGHSRTGVAGMGDPVGAMLKSCVMLGAAPAVEGEMVLTPVDYVSRSLVYLSRQRPAAGEAYHLVSPHTVSFESLLAAVNAAGPGISAVPLEDWLEALQQLLRDARDETLLPLAGLLPAGIPPQLLLLALRRPRFDCQRTAAILEPAGIVCPAADERLLATYVDSLLARESIVAPRP